ncbi:hypothetical protein GCM10025787_59710 [Saccharopolyspora rosea]|uniref:YbaB/EbfC family nucleoid-associated protein n=1 Tax=Saccharopolyspora rosea TaxID=524884 RepID=A0ABW3FWF5_9PSEU
MSGRDESSDLAARNAALRNQIDDMLADLRERTAQLQEKQDAAAAKTHEVTSEDGVITVRVDATGIVQQLSLGPKAFERATPERLAEQITSVIREATGTAQRELRAEFASFTESPGFAGVPGIPELPDFLPTRSLVQTPDPAAERARRAGKPAAPRSAETDEFDEFDGEWLEGGHR